MTPVYRRLRKRSREIAARMPAPRFYQVHRAACEHADYLLGTDPITTDLYAFVMQELEDDYGHGLQHAFKVAMDAGALMQVEGAAAGFSDAFLDRRTVVVQCACLLHDVKRKQNHHARAGAEFARRVLPKYPLSTAELEDICLAIRDHEAFRERVPIDTREGALVADCLYDADKFRWGPDNFKYTLWDMVAFYDPPLEKFIEHYPQGMRAVEKIKGTFRTATGRKFGPEFIDLGLAIGEALYEFLQRELKIRR
jgi:hypothetical protein